MTLKTELPGGALLWGQQEEGGRRLRQVICDGKWPSAALGQERPGHTMSTSADTLIAMHRITSIHLHLTRRWLVYTALSCFLRPQ